MAAALLLAATPAAASCPPGEPSPEVAALLAKPPEALAAEALGLYPRVARMAGIEGDVTLACRQGEGGALSGCVVVNETPEELHFGEAALALAAKRPDDPRICQTPGTITLGYAFRLSPPAVTSVAVGPASRPPPGAQTQTSAQARTGAASAPVPSGVTGPQVIRRPTADEVTAAYPRKADAARLPGRVRVSCAVGADGHPTDCRVLDETPPGQGFGEAALALARLYVMKPGTRDGRPDFSQRFVIPMGFTPE